MNHSESSLITYGRKMTDPTNTGVVSTMSTKYIPIIGGTSVQQLNYEDIGNAARKGESIWETSTSYSGSTGWFGDSTTFPYWDRVFFSRGGGYSSGGNSGIFGFSGGIGHALAGSSFRPVLVFQAI